METGRVEAFSDGVFAIAITLLILAVGIEEAISQGHLSDELLDLWPAYIAYAVSFLTVGIMWVNHHQIFRHFEHVDRTLLLLNILLLMLIAFTPFPTRVVAQHMESGVDREPAALLYGITMTLTAVCFFSVWYYGSRHLLRPDADRGGQRHHTQLPPRRADVCGGDADRLRQPGHEPRDLRCAGDLLCGVELSLRPG